MEYSYGCGYDEDILILMLTISFPIIVIYLTTMVLGIIIAAVSTQKVIKILGAILFLLPLIHIIVSIIIVMYYDY